MDAAFSVKSAQERPYDGRKATSREHLAALAVIEDLLDRRGIKHEFDNIDADVRMEIVNDLTEVIKLALTAY